MDSDNLRMCCQECNGLREAVGHCIGAMACVRTVARATACSDLHVARRWGLLAIASFIRAPRRAAPPPWRALGHILAWEPGLCQLGGTCAPGACIRAPRCQ